MVLHASPGLELWISLQTDLPPEIGAAEGTAMELLAEANKLPEPQQRKVAAVLGALVADAAGTHYCACFTRLWLNT